MTRSESSSSVTFMVPISAANAEPDRPLTAMAVSSDVVQGSEAAQFRSPLHGGMNPVQIAIKDTIGSASTPISSI